MKWVGSDLCKQGEERLLREEDGLARNSPGEDFAWRGKLPREGFCFKRKASRGFNSYARWTHSNSHKPYFTMNIIVMPWLQRFYLLLGIFFWICLSSKSTLESIILPKQPFMLLRILQCFCHKYLQILVSKILYQAKFTYISDQNCWSTCLKQVALKLNKLILEEPFPNCIPASFALAASIPGWW